MKLLHENAGKRSLKIFRIWVFGIWFLKIAKDPMADISLFPKDAFLPYGFFLKFWPEPVLAWLLSAPVLWGMKVLMLICLVCLLTRVLSKSAGLIFIICLILFQGMVRGFGYHNHSEMPLVFAAVVLVLFDIAEYLVLEKNGGRPPDNINIYSLPLTGLLLLICFLYAFIGIYRLIHGGAGIFLSDTLIYRIIEHAHAPRKLMLVKLDHLVIEYEWLRTIFKLGFPIGTLMEILAPFCLVSRHFRYVFLFVMLQFHIFIWLFMGIFFWEMLVLYVLFFDFSRWIEKPRQPAADVL